MEKSTKTVDEQVVSELPPSATLDEISLAQPLAKIETVKRTAEQIESAVEVNHSLSQLTVSPYQSWTAKIESAYGSGAAVYQAYLLHDLAASPENMTEGVAVLQHVAALEVDSAYQELLKEVDSIVLAEIANSAAEYTRQRLANLREVAPTTASSLELAEDITQLKNGATETVRQGLSEKGLSESQVASFNLSTVA